MFPYSDRFIPFRPDYLAPEMLSHPVVSSSSEPRTPQDVYASRVYRACTGRDAPPASILSYRRSHEPARTFSQQYIHDQAVAEKENQILSQYKKEQRTITPGKIYDATNLVDNFYSTVMDVSSKGMLVVALDARAYAMKAATVSDVDDAMDTDSPLTCVHFVGKEETIFVARDSGSFAFVDPDRQRVTHRGRVQESHIESCASSDPHTVYCGTSKGQVLQIDLRFNKAQTVGSHEGHVPGLSLHANAHALATGGNDNKIKIWDLRQPQQALHELEIHQAAVRALAWAPFDSKLLLSGGGTEDKKICATSFSTGLPQVKAIVATDSQVTQIIPVPERKEFVSSHGFSDNSCVLWELQDGQLTQKASIKDAKGRVLDIAFGSDHTLYAVAADERIRTYSGVAAPLQKMQVETSSIYQQIR